MGIPGMISILRNEGKRWSEIRRLSSTNLIIDATEEMYWFVKSRLLQGDHGRQDRFGSDMVEYGNFMRNFFQSLLRANIQPIVVYNGVRPKESTYGPRVSKAIHLDKSSRIRQMLLNRNGPNLDHHILSPLAAVVLKQVINELNLDDTHVVQSVYETYPKLAELANKWNCPVLTSHSDFVLTNVNQGFILAEELRFPISSANNEILCDNVYLHRRMAEHFRMGQCRSSLISLYALLRQDFCGTYYDVLNRMFSLPVDLMFINDDGAFRNGRPPRQQWRRRLKHILTNWSGYGLTSLGDVRHRLQSISRYNDELLRDYDMILKTFAEPLDWQQEVQTGQLIESNINQRFQVHQALVRRESTANFLMDIFMAQTNFNRGCVEDTETFRSTYSLADRAKLLLMSQASVRTLRLLDRSYMQLDHRYLTANERLQLDLSSYQMIAWMFCFPPELENSSAQMDQLLNERIPRLSRSLKGNNAQQLLILLLLIRHAFKLAFKQTYDTISQASLEAVSSSSHQQPSAISESEYARKWKRKMYDAVYNCFMYYAYRTQQDLGMLDMNNLEKDETMILINDREDNSFLPKIRLAVQEIDSNRVGQNPDISDTDYIQMKHVIEMLNSSLHAYCQLNSLYNNPVVSLTISRYYNGKLVYKILKYLQQKKSERSNLLTLSEDNQSGVRLYFTDLNRILDS